MQLTHVISLRPIYDLVIALLGGRLLCVELLLPSILDPRFTLGFYPSEEDIDSVTSSSPSHCLICLRGEDCECD